MSAEAKLKKVLERVIKKGDFYYLRRGVFGSLDGKGLHFNYQFMSTWAPHDDEAHKRSLDATKALVMKELKRAGASDFKQRHNSFTFSLDGETFEYDPNWYRYDVYPGFSRKASKGRSASKASSLIRLASALPKGSSERRAILRMAVPSVQEQEQFVEGELADAGKLSQVDAALAKYLVRTGLQDGVQDEDKIPVKPAKFKAQALKPSQTTIKLWGVLGMALQMIRKGKIGGDLGAIISSDNYIMDGHHRWAASILAGGKGATVGGWQADIPGKELIKVLNVVTTGLFGRMRGNKGTGSINDVNPRDARALLEDYIVNGIKGDYPVSAEQVQKDLIKGFGSVEKGIDIMSERTKLVNKSVPSWAPKRSDMPVIEPEETPAAAKALSQGRINWQPPYLSEQDRAEAEAAAVRLASSLPRGSKERRAILAMLRKTR